MAQNLFNGVPNVSRQKNVSSGKVYRQMFDAEVQLVSSLFAHKSRNLTLQPYHLVQSLPSSNESNCLPDNDVEKLIKEVLILPDIVPPKHSTSNILEKIKISKSSKHQETINILKKKIVTLGEELQEEIEAVSDGFLLELSKSHTFVQHILLTLDCHETLNLMTLHQLNALWLNIKEENSKRDMLTSEFETKINAMEDKRLSQMTHLLEETQKEMEKIGSLADPDLEMFITNQIQVLKKTMISNKREYSRLIANIKLNEFEFEQGNLSIWKDKVEIWKDTHQRMLLGKFSNFMDSKLMRDPTKPHLLLQDVIAKQSSLNKKRMEVFTSIKKLSLFDLAKQKFIDLKDNIFRISRDIDQVYEKNFWHMCSTYEEVHCIAVLQYQNLKSELITLGIRTEEEADDILALTCHRHLVKQKEFFERTVERLDKSAGRMNEKSLKMLKVFFDFCDVIVEMWTKHKKELALAEVAFMDQLSKTKTAGFSILQNFEVQLSLVSDRMRQSSTHEALGTSFEEANKLLEQMQQCCHENNTKEIEFLNKFGPSTSDLATFFVKDMLNHIGVDKIDSDGHQVKPVKEDAFLESLKLIAEESVENVATDKAENTEVKSSTKLEQNVKSEQVKGGNAADRNSLIACLDAFKEDKEPTILSCYLKDYLDFVEIKIDDVMCTKTEFQKMILSDLKGYSLKIMQRNQLFVKQQTENLKNEFELQIHVLERRSERLGKNIFEVRKAEIDLHSERFDSHKTHTLDAVVDSKLKMSELIEKHSRLFENFDGNVKTMSCEGDSTTTSSRLKKILKGMRWLHQSFMNEIKEATRMFVAEIDCSLRELHTSNLVLDKSLILFNDGGNFSPEEAKNYKKEIAHLMHVIITCEETTMRELEGIESDQYQQSLLVVTDFETRYEIKVAYLEFEENCEKMFRILCSKIQKEVLANEEQNEKLKKEITAMNKILEKEIGLSQYLDIVAETNQLIVKQATYLGHTFDVDPKSVPVKANSTKENEECVNQDLLQFEKSVLTISRPQMSLHQDGLFGVLANLYSINGDSSLINGGQMTTKSKWPSIRGIDVVSEKEELGENTFKGKLKIFLMECFNKFKELSEAFFKQSKEIPEPCSWALKYRDVNEFDEKLNVHFIEFDDLVQRHHQEALKALVENIQNYEDVLSIMFTNTLKRMYLLNMSKFKEQQELVECSLRKVIEDSNMVKALHVNSLRPALGHPHNEEMFEDLRRRERSRSNNFNKNTKSLLIIKQNGILDFMPKLLQQLIKYVKNSFKEVDKLYLKDISEKDTNVGSSPTAWSGLPNLEIFREMKGKIEKNISRISSLTAGAEGDLKPSDDNDVVDLREITSIRKTNSHVAIHKCALEMQENFFQCIGFLLAGIETDENVIRCEKMTMERIWNQSLKEIKSLYV